MAKKKAETVAKSNAIIFVIVALLIGWALGYGIAVAIEDDDTTTAESTTKTTGHTHTEVLELDPGAINNPSVKVLADQDSEAGWNLTLITENFTFTPENVNMADELNTGHAHVWVDGVKVGRIYGPNYHIPSQGEGEHEIRVTLNTNTHKDYSINGEVVADTIVVTETAGDKNHSHGDGHSDDDGHDHMHDN